MLKRSRLFPVQLLIDGLLLLFSFYLFYFIRKKEWTLRDHFDTYLVTLLIVWFVVTVLSKKFFESEETHFFPKVVELFYTVLKIGALVTILLYFTGWYHLSRVVIYGSLVFFLVLEVIFAALWTWSVNRTTGFQAFPFQAWFFLMELGSLVASFGFFRHLKKGAWMPQHEDAYLFFIILFLWFLVGITTHRFIFYTDRFFFRAMFPFWKAEAALFLSISFLFYFFKIFSFSRFIILFTIASFSLLENIILIWVYLRNHPRATDENEPRLFNSRVIEHISDKISHRGEPGNTGKYLPPFSTATASDILAKKLGKLYLGKYQQLYEWIKGRVELMYFDILESVVISTANPLNIEMLEENAVGFFLNLKEINDVRRLNCNFIKVNQKLKTGGVFIGCFQTKMQYKSLFFQRYPFVIARIFYFFHFLYKRVMPKMPFFKRFYFALTRGRNRVLSKAEVFGRLYYCGFAVLDIKVIEDYTWFICNKVAAPREDKNPSYGPLIRMKRLGKGGKIIDVYKFRTMHPYSEYMQNMITDLFGYDEKGKIKDDFRITGWGKFLRKYWLDELPQLLNLVKGDLRLVGPRPLSQRYFDNYPEDIKEERLKYRPGCVPPYVAYRMQGLEASIEAERIYFKKKKKHPIWTDVQVFVLAIFNIMSHRIISE